MGDLFSFGTVLEIWNQFWTLFSQFLTYAYTDQFAIIEQWIYEFLGLKVDFPFTYRVADLWSAQVLYVLIPGLVAAVIWKAFKDIL